MAKGKGGARRCKSCGEKLSPSCLWICECCQALGLGSRINDGQVAGEEILRVTRCRDGISRNPLEGLNIEEIAMLARMFQAPYSTYGKLRGYVDATGRLPDRKFERKR